MPSPRPLLRRIFRQGTEEREGEKQSGGLRNPGQGFPAAVQAYRLTASCGCHCSVRPAHTHTRKPGVPRQADKAWPFPRQIMSCSGEVTSPKQLSPFLLSNPIFHSLKMTSTLLGPASHAWLRWLSVGADLILGQGTGLGFGFGPQSGSTVKATDRCFSLFRALSMSSGEN